MRSIARPSCWPCWIRQWAAIVAAGISGPYGGANVTHDRTVYYYAETTAAMDIGRVPMEISWDDMTVHVLGAR